jgi:DNA-binding GntR family transcriptional regulator
MNTNTMTTNSTTTAASLNFANIETDVKSGKRVTLDMLAAQTGMTKANIRKALVSNYGARLVFARGRTGGIRISA